MASHSGGPRPNACTSPGTRPPRAAEAHACTSTPPFESAVVAADAALAWGLTSAGSLTGCLKTMGSVPGSRRAARVLAFADGDSESVGESRSRVLLHRFGLPAPALQYRVRRPDG